MTKQLSDVNCKYGAPMGRPQRGRNITSADRVRFSLQKVRIDSGGYDSGGAYWGVGNPLYWACSEDGKIERFFRALDRGQARRIINDEFHGARFFR